MCVQFHAALGSNPGLPECYGSTLTELHPPPQEALDTQTKLNSAIDDTGPQGPKATIHLL